MTRCGRWRASHARTRTRRRGRLLCQQSASSWERGGGGIWRQGASQSRRTACRGADRTSRQKSGVVDHSCVRGGRGSHRTCAGCYCYAFTLNEGGTHSCKAVLALHGAGSTSPLALLTITVRPPSVGRVSSQNTSSSQAQVHRTILPACANIWAVMGDGQEPGGGDAIGEGGGGGLATVEVQGACDGFEMPKGSWTMRRLAAAQRDASRLLQPCLALSL